MGFQLNLKGAQLALSVIKGSLTPEEARRQLRSVRSARECVAGTYGICQEHGQTLDDCNREK